MNLKFIYAFDSFGRTAATGDDMHIRDLIEQALFTNPGERVNRPDFGCGLLQLVFQPSSSELAITTQYLVQSDLNKWLGNLIEVNAVEVNSIDSMLEVTVAYTVLRTRQRLIDQFTR